jgi:FtsP/CotA-like multicopper oxidase with cupredoxin domain
VPRHLSRRAFVVSAAACVGSGMLSRSSSAIGGLLARRENSPAPVMLRAVTRTLEINGKPASVLGLLQPNGQQGIISTFDRPFDVILENKLSVQTAIHWHGLQPPNNEDGVPGLTQPFLAPGTSTRFDFPLRPAGTHWMHSHAGLQEASLLAAPLIVQDGSENVTDEQEIILLLGDFSFTPPAEIYSKLRQPSGESKAAMGSMNGKPAAPKKPEGMNGAKPDVNDVNYDAYLANDRTLDDPEVVRVEKGGRVRLRIINGSSGTNYFIDLGGLTGELIATDGMPVVSVRASVFPLAIAQRADIRLQLPPEGAFPILALREGASEQTGIILATAGATIKRLPAKNEVAQGLLTLDLESRLAATTPLAEQPIDRSYELRLTGNMMRYEWSINGVVFDTNHPGAQPPQVRVKLGQRVALKFVNQTPMAHPMHLHGHSFQVVEVNGQAIKGALRDTVLLPGRSTVTVVFDANNPGVWYVHCHVLWHLAAGMATLVQYDV